MTADTLPFDVPAHAADAQAQALLHLIAGDPRHESDRAKITAAIVAEARTNAGKVDTNRLRARLTHPGTGELDVTPVVIGATINALANRGALQPVGWTTNTDTRGRNSGKPCRVWRLVATSLPAPASAGRRSA